MKEIGINELQVNPYTLFGKDWMALTAGTEKDGFNYPSRDFHEVYIGEIVKVLVSDDRE